MILFPMLQSTMTSMPDPWLLNKINHDNSITYTTRTNDLGWTQEQIIETYLKFKTFEQDWDRHDMDIYDK